jgi:SH3-like domain-containing protein
MMSRSQTRLLTACAIALLTAGGAVAAEEEEAVQPRTGEINAHEVNIRAGAHLNYEILTQLDKGDLVLVTGTRGDWTRIAMPPGVLAWVSSKFVAEDGLVEAENVNVRSGPSLKHNLLCQLDRDQQVVVVKESGEWYGIMPPDDAWAWVHSNLVDDKGEAALYTAWAPRKAKCMALLAAADDFRSKQLHQAEADIDFDAILANYQRLEKDYADMPEARTVKMRIREVERIRRDVEERLGNLAAAGTTTQEDTTSETTEQGEQPDEPEVKYLKATGVLREISKESTKKGLYRVTRDDRWICIVKSETIDLGTYAGKTVEVIGTEAPSEGWSLRTVDVLRVKLLE